MPKLILIFSATTLIIFASLYVSQQQKLQQQSETSNMDKAILNQKLASVSAQLKKLKETDQIKKNEKLEKEIKNIETTYKKSVSTYESLQDLKSISPKLDKKFDALLAKAISELANRNFSSASAVLEALDIQIKSENVKIIVASIPPAPTAPPNNFAPGSGFSRQSVHTESGDFVADIIAADLGSTKVIVDTASDNDCRDNCPVLSLGDYVARSGAYAGVNGSYFCPADYPSCAGKTNSFDLLVMNKNKKYLNSDNNVYSTNPAVIFGNGYIRFVSQTQQWGRDTGVDGVLSNFPLLVSGGNNTFGGNSDPKMGSAGNRSFVANKGNTVYIGVNHNVTVAQSALVLKALGMDNAMNLDSGGSTALWFGGYKDGPGRNLPNAILFVKK
jgi:hypothetical protein